MIDKGRKEAMSFDIARKAKLRAVHLLEYRDRTEKDMRRKLQQGGYPAEIIEETMEYLRAYGYIDDKRYAPAWNKKAAAVCSRSFSKKVFRLP